MKQHEFSEFSYGFGFTENLLRESRAAPMGAPVFPNLIDEGGLGYDLRLDFPAQALFFQFKLADHMKGSRAAEIYGGYCPDLPLPYFRFPITRRNVSDQHRHLVELEGDNPNAVFYAAPTVNDKESFNQAYLDGVLCSESALFSPAEIDLLPDDSRHCVVYAPDRSVAYFCSEPRSMKGQTLGDVESRLVSGWNDGLAPELRTVAPLISEQLLKYCTSPIRQSVDDMRARARDRLQGKRDGTTLAAEIVDVAVELIVAREISRIALGVEFVIAQPSIHPADLLALADLRI